jgi:hypothetical protein
VLLDEKLTTSYEKKLQQIYFVCSLFWPVPLDKTMTTNYLKQNKLTLLQLKKNIMGLCKIATMSFVESVIYELSINLSISAHLLIYHSKVAIFK